MFLKFLRRMTSGMKRFIEILGYSQLLRGQAGMKVQKFLLPYVSDILRKTRVLKCAHIRKLREIMNF